VALSPIERIRLDKAAVDKGFGLNRSDNREWLAYDSLGAPASIRLTFVAPDGSVANFAAVRRNRFCTEGIGPMSDFKGRHFEGEIVLWAVRWYCRSGVSYRDLE